MVVGISRIELYLPGGGSLKEKRKILRSMKERIRRRYNVSISEVGDHELWQKAILGVAFVGQSHGQVRQVTDQIHSIIRGNPAVEIVHYDIDVQ